MITCYEGRPGEGMSFPRLVMRVGDDRVAVLQHGCESINDALDRDDGSMKPETREQLLCNLDHATSLLVAAPEASV
jgi:hypothetical protein